MLLPTPPIAAPIPNGAALPRREAPCVTANFRRKRFFSSSATGPIMTCGMLEDTISPQKAFRSGDCPMA
jgi:hypothetical protein